MQSRRRPAASPEVHYDAFDWGSSRDDPVQLSPRSADTRAVHQDGLHLLALQAPGVPNFRDRMRAAFSSSRWTHPLRLVCSAVFTYNMDIS